MAAPPVTAEGFYELVRRSEVVTPKRLDAYLALRRPDEGGPADARAAAQAALTDGLAHKVPGRGTAGRPLAQLT